MGEAGAVMIADEADQRTYMERIAELSVGGAALDLTEPRPLKLTVDDLVLLDRYWRDDDHKSTELIDGRIYTTPARFRPRVNIVQEIWHQLREAAAVAAPHLFVGMRGSVEISRFDLPLPDIVLTSEPHGDGFIPAASVPLIVEVAETALDFYMGEKMRLYARAGIPEYWVADVSSCTTYQMWSPLGKDYGNKQSIPFSNLVSTETIDGLAACMSSVET